MIYGDEMLEVELGDTVEVNEAPEEFEPEEATVVKIGKAKIQVEFKNTMIKPRKVWVKSGVCNLISREA